MLPPAKGKTPKLNEQRVVRITPLQPVGRLHPLRIQASMVESGRNEIVLIEGGRNGGDVPGRDDVVGIDEDELCPGCMADSEVRRAGGARVRSRVHDPEVEALLESLGDLARGVGRAVVDEDDLPFAFELLAGERLELFVKVLSRVQKGNDDAHLDLARRNAGASFDQRRAPVVASRGRLDARRARKTIQVLATSPSAKRTTEAARQRLPWYSVYG